MHIQIILDNKKQSTLAHESLTIAENRPFAPEFQSSIDVAKQDLENELTASTAAIAGKIKLLNSAIEAAS